MSERKTGPMEPDEMAERAAGVLLSYSITEPLNISSQVRTAITANIIRLLTEFQNRLMIHNYNESLSHLASIDLAITKLTEQRPVLTLSPAPVSEWLDMPNSAGWWVALRTSKIPHFTPTISCFEVWDLDRENMINWRFTGEPDKYRSSIAGFKKIYPGWKWLRVRMPWEKE